MKLSEKGYPIILVFYIERGMMSDKPLFNQYAENITAYLESRGANIITLFMPTDEENERIECLNPMLIDDVEHKDIADMLIDVKKSFGF